ncbi:MAG: AmmeMemoRadiSam system radical SAM enzyme, partial [Deltaproteobacteria bacterium]|nr:AmmeMemoRadiSam system radical SAM enzyme [Deltaproteobacteria bacterium]
MSTWWQACVGRAVSRRTFLKTGVCSLALLALPPRAKAVGAPDPRQGFVNPQPALYYRALAGHKISCQLCPRACEVGPGDRGDCGVRENRQGRYLTLAYGNPCAVHVDPIEKKPFFHVLPGTPSFSLATAGCNLRCQFCQNYEISQARPEETYNMDLPPAQVVARARQAGCPSVAYTYVEPIIFFEYMLETSRLARQAGLLNTCHSAGYVSAAPLEELAQVLDAACIDLKAFDPGFYRELVDGELEPVLATLETLRRRGVHVEIVNLVIPRKNDDPGAITRMCRWIADELGPLTPL